MSFPIEAAAACGAAGELLQRLAKWQALGGRFRAGQVVQAAGLELTAVPGGRADDPVFNQGEELAEGKGAAGDWASGGSRKQNAGRSLPRT